MIPGNNGNNQEFYDLCEQAIELLNKKKQLQLKLKSCWLFSNSAGSNFHIFYHDESVNENFQLCGNGKEKKKSTTSVDKEAGLEKLYNIKLRMALRIAYLIYIKHIKHNK